VGAVAATADHRVRRIVTFVDDVNAARLSLCGLLVVKASALGLPKDWSNRFSRRASRSARNAPDTTPPAPHPV
jgi:predicted ATPase